MFQLSNFASLDMNQLYTEGRVHYWFQTNRLKLSHEF